MSEHDETPKPTFPAAGRHLPSVVALHDIRDIEKFCRGALRKLPSGMYLQPSEYEDELSECILQLLRIERAWDRTRTKSFAQYASYRLIRHYIKGDLPRRLLGRTGTKAAGRLHSELTETAEGHGRRPWEHAPAERDEHSVAASDERSDADRALAMARARAVLGLEAA